MLQIISQQQVPGEWALHRTILYIIRKQRFPVETEQNARENPRESARRSSQNPAWTLGEMAFMMEVTPRLLLQTITE